jgi:hypothetical protein
VGSTDVVGVLLRRGGLVDQFEQEWKEVLERFLWIAGVAVSDRRSPARWTPFRLGVDDPSLDEQSNRTTECVLVQPRSDDEASHCQAVLRST